MGQSGTFPADMLGGCRCSRIRYRVTGAPKFIYACHCADCQQLTASAFSLGMPVEDAQFTLVAGTPKAWVKTADSGKQSTRFFCPDCGGWTHTRTESQPGVTSIRCTTLDQHTWVRPIAQIFARSALPWALMATQFTYDKEFKDPKALADAFALGNIGPGAEQ